MSYSYEPNELSPAYRPLFFRNARTTTSAAENVRVDVYCFGTKQATFRKPYITKSGNDYTWDIDVQSVIQRYLTPKTDNSGTITAVFASLTNWEVVFPTDSYCSYYIDTFLEVRNANGLIETPSGTQETSTTKYAISATRPNTDLDLESFYQNGGTPFNFLTDAPTAVDVGLSENYSLGVIAQGLTSVQYKFYDGTGALSSTVSVDVAASAAAPGLWSITCGPANLLNFAGSLHSGSDSMPTAFNVGEYFTVTCGATPGAASAYSVLTEERRFDIVGRCAHALRLEWINSFGSADQYTFEGAVIKRNETKGKINEVSLPWNPALTPPMAASKHGLIKTDIESQVMYELREAVSYEVADFLRHIASTPEVFVQKDGVRVAVAVENASNDIDVSGAGEVEVSFSVIAEQEITQEI